MALLAVGGFVCGPMFCPMLGIAAPAAAASRNARPAVAPSPPPARPHRGASPVIPAAPVFPPAVAAGQTGIGICQCIADHARRDINCLGSADACKATCGEHYSFVPNAPSCPITAQVGG
ncbi:MAG: hypothetical protein ACM3JG_12905 [Thiohalocapsa sp.]